MIEHHDQIIGRVCRDVCGHEGEAVVYLNSVGRGLPDGACLYASPQKELLAKSDPLVFPHRRIKVDDILSLPMPLISEQTLRYFGASIEGRSKQPPSNNDNKKNPLLPLACKLNQLAHLMRDPDTPALTLMRKASDVGLLLKVICQHLEKDHAG